MSCGANRRWPSTPVILLSARAGEESRVEGLEAGADDYLVKPFAAKELLARVRSHLESARLRQAAEAERQRLRVLLGQVPAIVNFLRGPDLVVRVRPPAGHRRRTAAGTCSASRCWRRCPSWRLRNTRRSCGACWRRASDTKGRRSARVLDDGRGGQTREVLDVHVPAGPRRPRPGRGRDDVLAGGHRHGARAAAGRSSRRPRWLRPARTPRPRAPPPRPPTAPRTNSWPCWATSCETRCRRS